MKKIPIITILLIFCLTAVCYGAYTVETNDDEYVSDTVFFAPVSTWEKVDAQVINLKKGRIIFYAGRENTPEQIDAAVMPINATDKKLSYKSDDITIVSVDKDGLVTPTGKSGETFIEITCGKAKARMKVSVVKGVEGIAMSQSEMTLYADKRATAQLEALIYPADATIQDVSWKSEDKSIAYVDKDGLVYPSGVGTTDIYAEAADGGYKAKCTVTVTTFEKRTEDIPVTYTDYNYSLDDMVKAQMDVSPTIFTSNAYPAIEEEVRSFSDPENLTSGYERYQFLDLSMENGIDADTLDNYLYGKGILDGTGKAFKEAAEENGISEVYLVIHACLESGNGTSQLACGAELVDGTIVYNMFGIGAVDADPLIAGVQYAYEHGWTTVEKAIKGGAEWISDNYINNMRYGQNTLYKMRWNPAKPAVHQYATDIEWASKQAKNMGAMFEAFPSAHYKFDVPRYRQ